MSGCLRAQGKGGKLTHVSMRTQRPDPTVVSLETSVRIEALREAGKALVDSIARTGERYFAVVELIRRERYRRRSLKGV